MCCRYYMELSPELRPIIEEAERSPLRERMVNTLGRPLITSGEASPTDILPVIATAKNGGRSVFPMVWGFHVKGLDRPLINARVETAAAKPSFRESWARRRCIVPASWYFEWEHFTRTDGKVITGDRYAIQPAGSGLCFLAGLYRIEEERGLSYPVFTILTREPGEELRSLHDRMPLILPSDKISTWIDPETKPEDLLPSAVTDVMFEKG